MRSPPMFRASELIGATVVATSSLSVPDVSSSYQPSEVPGWLLSPGNGLCWPDGAHAAISSKAAKAAKVTSRRWGNRYSRFGWCQLHLVAIATDCNNE